MEKIFEARTEHEAVEKAVRTFGVSEEYIEIKVISKKKGNFLGLNSKVVINASVIGIPKSDAIDNEEKFATSSSGNSSFEESYDQNLTKSKDDVEDVSSGPRAERLPFLPLTEHQKKEVVATIEALTSKMNIELDVEFQTIDGMLYASLIIEDPDDQKLLIGKHGKNIEALQVLVNVIIQKKYASPLERVVVEIGNYRNRRISWLVDLAQEKANLVLKSKHPYTFGEMPPYDRKLVHTAVKNISGVTSKSIGNGYYRRLAIHIL